MVFGSERQGVEHLFLSGEARSSQAPASEASEERAEPASGEPAACARVLLLRPLLGFLGFFPARPLAQPPLETAVAPSRWVPRVVFLVL